MQVKQTYAKDETRQNFCIKYRKINIIQAELESYRKKVLKLKQVKQTLTLMTSKSLG